MNKQRGNLSAIPLKKVKFNVKSKEATDIYQTSIRCSSPNYALAIRTTISQSQSLETNL
jgi:hypothetical protein